MPGAHQVARKDVLELEAVETRGVGAIVRGGAAHQGLEQKHQRDEDIELEQRALTGTGIAWLRVGAHRMAATEPAQIVELSKCQQHGGDAAKQHGQAQCTPQNRAGNRRVANARIERKVVGIGMVLAGPIGHGRPRRPAHEGGECTQFARVAYQVRFQPAVVGGMLEVVGPVADLLPPRLRFRCSERQYTGDGIIPIGFQHQRDFGLQTGALHRVQLVELLVELRLRQRRGGVLAHRVQRLGRIVRAKVSAVTPDAAVVHQSVLQEHRLAVAYVGVGEQRRALRVGNDVRNRRRVAIGERRDRDQYGEADHHYDRYGAQPPRRERTLVRGIYDRIAGGCRQGRGHAGFPCCLSTRRMRLSRPAHDSILTSEGPPRLSVQSRTALISRSTVGCK